MILCLARIGGSFQPVLTPDWVQEGLMGSKYRGVHVQQPRVPLSRQSWETQNVTLSISSSPLGKSPSETSLSPADLLVPLTGPCYPGTGEMQIDFISAMAFLKQRYENQREMSNCGRAAYMKRVVYSDRRIMKQDTS